MANPGRRAQNLRDIGRGHMKVGQKVSFGAPMGNIVCHLLGRWAQACTREKSQIQAALRNSRRQEATSGDVYLQVAKSKGKAQFPGGLEARAGHLSKDCPQPLRA